MDNLGVLWITGAAGMVGAKLVAAATRYDCFERIYAFTHTQSSPPMPSPKVIWSTLDIGDNEALQLAAQTYKPDVIINCAALANVDECERHHDTALHSNYMGAQYLAQISRQSKAHLIHLSTDYVFPGDEEQPGPYSEDSKPCPINFYGQTKLKGEHAVLNICERKVPYTIIRTSWVYGLSTDKHLNFVTWLVKELKAGRQVRIVRDQWSTPTLVNDLVNIILWATQHRRTGIYHVAGPEFMSRHQWALTIADHFGLNIGLIKDISSLELGQVAVRPCFAGLKCERLQKDLTYGAPRPYGATEGLLQIDQYF